MTASGGEDTGKVVLLKAVQVQVDGGAAPLTLKVAFVRSRCSAASPDRIIPRQIAQMATDCGANILRKTRPLTQLEMTCRLL